MAILFSALLLGLAGSFHCAGMCGPIAIALPLHGNNFIQKVFGGTFYNLGRTITYGVFGALFGLLGQGIQLVGFQQKVSVIMGAFMIIAALFPTLFKNRGGVNKTWVGLVSSLKKSMGKLFSVRTYPSLFFIGMLNGLLPCGLVYMAVAGAIGTGEVVLGALYMILFGLGTIPMLLAISLAGNIMSLAVREKINKLIPVLVVVVGIFFILRGLSLGIPYLSPPKQKIEMKFEKSLQQNAAELHNESKGDCCSTNESKEK